jgi:hypothetical protein
VCLGTRVPSGTREVRQPFYTGLPALIYGGIVVWYTGACLDLIVGDVDSRFLWVVPRP